MSAQALTVGFVGLGSQGGPMARRIADAGWPTILWARRPEALDPYRDTAATFADDLGKLARASDVLCICVVDDAGVRAVFDEVLQVMRARATIVIHSTIDPATCTALAAEAGARGIDLIDAPVSGGGEGAAAGTLTIMVGGEADALAKVRPVFESYAGLIVHLGPVGAGQHAKLVNNTLMAANMALADAALAAGAALGIDGKALADLIKVSSGRSFGFEVRARLPNVALFGHGAKLLAKDVGLLGGVLGDDPAFATLAAAASPFLNTILNNAERPA